MKEPTKDQFVFAEFCKNSKKVIDVGAQSGEFVNIANKNMNDGIIYALEPDQNYIDKLDSIKSINNNQIITNACAAGSEKSKAKLHNSSTGCMANVAIKARGVFSMVDVDTLDNLFPFEVDLIKVDVEAYEYEVLLGASSHLDRGTPFLIEIHDKWLKESGRDKDDIIKIFTNKGYKSEFLYRPDHQRNWADLYYYMFTK